MHRTKEALQQLCISEVHLVLLERLILGYSARKEEDDCLGLALKRAKAIIENKSNN